MCVDDYRRLTFREYELMRDGYMRKLDMQKELNMEDWRRARFIAFQSIRPHLKNQHLSITDFMPLEGDQSKHSEAESLAVIEYYKQKGWLKEAKA